MLFGQVKGSTPPGRPRKIWNDSVLSDFQLLNITRPYRDAQNKPAWRERTWATHTYAGTCNLLLLLLLKLGVAAAVPWQ